MAEYVNVNIHNTGLIPILGRKGPIWNMGMSNSLYRRLKAIPGIEIFTVQEDRVRSITQKKVEVKKEAPAPEVVKEEIVITPEEEVIKVEVEADDFDKLIESQLEEIPEEEAPDIVLNEQDLKEIAEKATIKKYTATVLADKTKAEIKSILNDERGYQPGEKYYGRYKDTHPVLVKKVLDSQK